MTAKLPALLIVGLAFTMLSVGCAQTAPPRDRDLNAEAMTETSRGRWGELPRR